MSRGLIWCGLFLVVLGIAWPWLAKLGLGHLPGDIYIERKDFDFYFPITTGILISLVITLAPVRAGALRHLGDAEHLRPRRFGAP